MTDYPELTAPVRGAHFRIKENPAIEQVILSVQQDEVLDLEREPDNPYDENAIRVLKDEHFIGFVAREVAEIIAPVMDSGVAYKATVYGFNNSITPVVFLEPAEEDAELPGAA